MAQDTTVIEHLMQGRQALEREVARLNEAMTQLDSVIALFESGTPSSGLSGTSPLVRSSAGGATSATVSASTEPRAPRRPAKKAIRTKRESFDTGDAPKSIREHVLDMLASDNRDFGLAEIIDRIHGLGIQAHDDAVRSITIKLMKDGQVERVGRGQYRLASGARSKADAAASDSVAATEDSTDSQDSSPVDATEQTIEDDAASEDVAPETVDESADTAEQTASDEAPQDSVDTDEPAEQPERQSSSYTPPLNLGQPWN